MFIKVALYLLCLNLLSGNFFFLSPPLNGFCSLLFLIIFSLFCYTFETHINKDTHHIENWLLMAVSLGLVIQKPPLNVIGLGLFWLACYGVLSYRDEKNTELILFAVSTCFYALFITVSDLYAVFWFIENWISTGLSFMASLLIKGQISYGHSFTGQKVSLSFICFILTSLLASKPRHPVRHFIATLAILAANILFISIHALVLNQLTPLGQGPLGRLVPAQFGLYVLLLLPLYFHLKTQRQKRQPSTINRFKLTAGWFLVLLVGFNSLIVNLSSPILEKGTGKILLYDQAHLDLRMPDYSRLGGHHGGMFGALVHLLKMEGFEVASGPLAATALDETRVLVMINLERKLNRGEKSMVDAYLKKGGALLIVGDHTGVNQIRGPFNDLLKPYHIQFNFDSALALVPDRRHNLNVRPHPIGGSSIDDRDLQIWIGGSLKLRQPARPLVIARHYFSDRGNYHAPQLGFLGNMHYLPGERLGDLAVVAETKRGRGRILVFGDSSPFQNMALPQSSGFVIRIFRWLARAEQNPVNGIRTTAWLLGSLLIFGLYLVFRRHGHLYIAIAAMLAATGAMASVDPSFVSGEDNAKMPIAYLDNSHLERFDLDSWGKPASFGGFAYHLMRNGYFPMVLRNLEVDRLQGTKLFTVIAPARPYAAHEVDALETFVKLGGCLIVAAGYEDSNGCAPLLDRFGLRVRNLPLGKANVNWHGDQVQFSNAWALESREADSKALVKILDHPVAMHRTYGLGNVLLFGDTSFLLNRNLESLQSYRKGNIQFLRDIFEQLKLKAE